MHELGLARAIGEAIRARGWEGLPLEVRVSGGHGDGGAFEAALLAHLECESPSLAGASVRIVRVSCDRVCSRCAGTFRAADASPCPACGGPALPLREAEQVELVIAGEEEACA